MLHDAMRRLYILLKKHSHDDIVYIDDMAMKRGRGAMPCWPTLRRLARLSMPASQLVPRALYLG